jgi:hypothetical protein
MSHIKLRRSDTHEQDILSPLLELKEELVLEIFWSLIRVSCLQRAFVTTSDESTFMSIIQLSYYSCIEKALASLESIVSLRYSSKLSARSPLSC